MLEGRQGRTEWRVDDELASKTPFRQSNPKFDPEQTPDTLLSMHSRPYDVETLILVGNVRVATRVDDHIFGLSHKRGRKYTEATLRVGRHEVADLAYVQRVGR